METLATLIDEMVKTGVPDAAGQPAPKGDRIRRPRGRFTITDGPFAETKELIAGAVC